MVVFLFFLGAVESQYEQSSLRIDDSPLIDLIKVYCIYNMSDFCVNEINREVMQF